MSHDKMPASLHQILAQQKQVECRHGWRLFKCEECDLLYWEVTRDRFSPSHENCPQCGEVVDPIGNKPDGTLKKDEWGELAEYPPYRVVQ